MTTVTDNFNRTAETPLASPWTSVIGGGANSNGSAAVSTGGTERRSLYSGTFANDQWASGVVGALSASTQYAMVCVRLATTGGGQGYEGYTDGTSGTGHTAIARWDAGSQTEIAAVATTFSSSDVMKITAVGTTITMYKNGVSVGSVVDATYASGNPGCGGFGVATVDDFIGSDNFTIPDLAKLKSFNNLRPRAFASGLHR